MSWTSSFQRVDGKLVATHSFSVEQESLSEAFCSEIRAKDSSELRVSRFIIFIFWLIYQKVTEPEQRSRYSHWLRAGRTKGRSSSPGRAKNSSLLHVVVVAHPASYSMGTGGSFPGDEAAGVWSWSPTSNYCRGQENMDLCIHSPIRLHGVVLNYLSIGTTLPLTFFFSGVGLTSPGTAATSGLLYSPKW
jgi:hypothetical protein